ncbi:MAG: hypothetical protein M5U09_01855 [Gammaproteobacteria bacterium]|nr:hypothetical protein [Gammaproteobacteria bacterium]
MAALLGLGKYFEVLTANDVDFDVFPQLTEEHLRELGLSWVIVYAC